jgi:hypothetical protein
MQIALDTGAFGYVTANSFVSSDTGSLRLLETTFWKVLRQLFKEIYCKIG